MEQSGLSAGHLPITAARADGGRASLIEDKQPKQGRPLTGRQQDNAMLLLLA
jgi:hypothetical protein